MCQEAVKIINERADRRNFQIPQNFQTDIVRDYALDMNSEYKLVQAFKCPTMPPLALQVHEQNAVQIIGIIVRHSDLRSIGPRVHEIRYKMKIVEQILPTEQYGKQKVFL
jgi:hypothetical protein